MTNIETIVRQINKDLVPQFEEKLRAYLMTQNKEWLIEQIVRLTLDAHSLEENDRQRTLTAIAKSRAERVERLRKLALNAEVLKSFLKRWQNITRQKLIEQGYLSSEAPAKGTDLIEPAHRSRKGERLLTLSKDLLFGLLFGEANMQTKFDRIEREMLTLTLPRPKFGALDFMKATTEFSALGTWQDPKKVSNDSRAENVILEVEYGEVAGEWIGKGIVAALRLVNNLEVNEQILYARMVNVEQSTLIE
jgi:hypothetical protein